MNVRQGQVQGAFFKHEIGDIDLIWGDSKKGLQHILERRTAQYGEEKALKFINDIPRMIEESVIFEKTENKIILKTPSETLILGKRENNSFVLSGYYESKNAKKMETSSPSYEASFTSKSGTPADDILLQNQANHNTQTLTRQQADDLFNEYLNANAKYAEIKESFKDKLVKDMLKGMDKKTLNSKLTTEQWKKRVLDTDWGDSVKGLKGTIFEKFNPKMQEDTQMLFIFRALDRNINELSDNTPINFSKILNDLEKLENLQLAPKVYPVLDLFKSYSKAYQFSQEIAKAKGLEMMHGGGAMATTLSGRLQVFMTNRLFKKLFAYIPYLGDNNAILKSLSKAIKDLKYPSEITLETLKQLKDADIKKGFKPNATDNNVPLNEITQTAIKSDKDLQNIIKHSKDKRILDSKTENELETLATNPHLLELENTHKYETQTLERQTQFFNSIERTKDELAKGDFVAKENIKQDTELINLIKDNLENNTVFTPDNVAMNIIKDEKTYTFIQDKHGISYIYKLPREKPTPPRTYDELRAKENADNAELQSYKDQTQTIIEKRKLQGDNFTMADDGTKPKTDYNVTLEIPPHVRDLANLKDEHIMADLEFLASKHPEMFKKPSEVFRLIKDIKEYPEHFYKNNRLESALIIKRLNNEKIGKMVIKKDDGKVIHATKVKDKDLKRIERVSDSLKESNEALALSKLSSNKVAKTTHD